MYNKSIKYHDQFSSCRKVYWSDQGYGSVPPKIARCDSDGSNPTNLVTSEVGQVQHIALDIAGGRIYWGQLNPGHVSILVKW